jgi:hypothetical protein
MVVQTITREKLKAKMVERITAPLLKELYPEKNEKSDNY